MKYALVFALSCLALAACSGWSPRTHAAIVADRQQDRQVANTVTDMKRDRGAPRSPRS